MHDQEYYSPKKIFLVALLITLLTFTFYLPALNNDFINWDDDKYIYENEHIRSFDINLLIWCFGFHVLNWHPLTWISHAIDYALWGLNPIGHHLHNIILHSANTVLVFIILLLLLKQYKNSETSFTQNKNIISQQVVTASFASILFGIHPIHVESVVWISERKDVLSTFFLLLSILFYSKYVIRMKTGKHTIAYITSIFFFILALMSKSMVITLPLILIILDFYPFQRIRFSKGSLIEKKVILEKIPFVFLSIIVAVLTFLAQRSGGAMASLKSYPLLSRFISAIEGLSFYLVKMVLPIGLTPFYPVQKNLSIFSYEFIFSLILLIVICFLCLWLWKRNMKIFMVVLAYYTITLLPVIGIIKLGEHAVADRYAYIPSIGPFFLLGLGVSIAINKYYSKNGIRLINRTIIFFILTSFIISLNILTIKQIKVWTNSITLWGYVIKKYPKYWLAYYNRAHAYILLGKYKNAQRDIKNAIKYYPDHADAHYVYAINLIGLKDYNKAKKELDKAIKLEPNFAQAYYIRAYIYKILGDNKMALIDLNRCISLDPNNHKAYNDRGLLLFNLGKVKKAILDYSKAISINPNQSLYYYNRGIAYLKIGKEMEALKDFKISVRLGNK